MKTSFLKLTLIAALIAAIALPAAEARLNGAYYGTNYTVPFAHAYRALDSLGVDRRDAIDRDVYHMARLGLNAFRLHLWDVELSDAEGRLLDNEHLALLDKLIASLRQRNIAIILTAQTNFGNGYPERNIDPNGAYSYRFEKCRVHDNPDAQNAQERYLRALVAHVNSETGLTYADDPAILAVEINNEPCHSGSHTEITAYVDRMASALRSAGWKKDIIYNVSHNLWRTSAFYRADIDGTTYQWYPTGLVKGSMRRGNFLPALDSYDIPFDTVPGFAAQPKLIYEYDPADVLDTYLYPAAARTFRKAGFDWVTQFAYDPVDMARFNSEYQTHFLNLAYTPGKAIGMAIAAEVMRKTPVGKDYGKYPADTVFGDFTVSARRNLAMLNDGKAYYHTNTTADAPRDLRKLSRIAGVGSSPVVTTDGTGAYFIDRLDRNTWRLEVMPDVVLTSDPFTRPSLSREVAQIIDAPVSMTLSLPGLAEGFCYEGARGQGSAAGMSISVFPGVYLIGNKASDFAAWPAERVYDSTRGLRIAEYTMPPVSRDFGTVLTHTAPARVPAGSEFTLEATVVSSAPVDSVVLIPATADFWRNDNRTYPMTKTGKYTYSTTIDPLGKKDGIQRFDYSIVVYGSGRATTFPAGEAGSPLDWDFGAGRSRALANTYNTLAASSDAPIVLLDGRFGLDNAEFSAIPETWRGTGIRHTTDEGPWSDGAICLYRHDDADAVETLSVSKYVGDIMASWPDTEATSLHLRLGATEALDSINVGLVTRDGFTYSAPVAINHDATAVLELDTLALTPTLLNPAPYPSFLGRRFTPDPTSATPFRTADIESIVLSVDNPSGPFKVEIKGICLSAKGIKD